MLSLSFCATAVSATDAPLKIDAEGLVAHPGVSSVPATGRYSDAALAASPTAEAYLLGAALLRSSLVDAQTRLRAGAIYDLGELARRAGKDGDDALMNRAMTMLAWIRALPVTGRQVALLDPRVVEVTAEANLPLENGDVLHYPVRPATVRIVGAVVAPCEVAHVPMQDARRYLAACPADRLADADDFFVIQPDGRVIRQGRALWNLSDPLALAPGAVLYVPIRTSATVAVDPDLDKDVATFLGTQVLP
jgi:hypothetical protein